MITGLPTGSLTVLGWMFITKGIRDFSGLLGTSFAVRSLSIVLGLLKGNSSGCLMLGVVRLLGFSVEFGNVCLQGEWRMRWFLEGRDPCVKVRDV